MRGVVFDLSIPKYVLAKGVGRWAPAVHYGRGSCLSLRELAEPEPPGPDWAGLRPVLAGVCGSDLGTIFFRTSPALEPFNSFPAVLGHEVLARVARPAARLREGDRVVVDPLLPCALRGVDPPCAGCAAGRTQLCASFARGHLAPGMMLGYCRGLPGGFSDRMVARADRCFPVPDAVPDRRAALTEPLAVATHALLIARVREQDRVLVIGGGMIGLGAIAAMRLAGVRPAVLACATLLDYQADLARALGATEAIVSRGLDHLIEETCRLTGAVRHRPILGPPVVAGGWDVVLDCVGERTSLDAALRLCRPGGTVVLVGAASFVDRLDMTPVWSRELRVLGSFVYGPEPAEGGRHTFEVVLERLTDESLAAPIDALVTHVFPLEGYREAIQANVDRARYRSVKTLLSPQGGSA